MNTSDCKRLKLFEKFVKVLVGYFTLHLYLLFFRWSNKIYRINLSSSACLEVEIQNKLCIKEKSKPANIY